MALIWFGQYAAVFLSRCVWVGLANGGLVLRAGSISGMGCGAAIGFTPRRAPFIDPGNIVMTPRLAESIASSAGGALAGWLGARWKIEARSN